MLSYIKNGLDQGNCFGRLEPRNLKGGIGSLFDPCVNTMGWLPNWSSRMKVSYCTFGFGAIIRRDPLRVSFLKLWTFYFDSSLCCRALHSCHQIWPKLPLIKVICLANFQHMSSTKTFTKPRTTCMIQVLFCLLTDSYQIWHNMISFKILSFCVIGLHQIELED